MINLEKVSLIFYDLNLFSLTMDGSSHNNMIDTQYYNRYWTIQKGKLQIILIKQGLGQRSCNRLDVRTYTSHTCLASVRFHL
jgi:hypothetical protein